MESFFVCENCGNSNKKYIGIRNGIKYCRLCLEFSGKKVKYVKNNPINAKPLLNYELTNEQKEISLKVTTNFIKNKNTLIYAVCGAGKTELVYDVISYALKKGMQVGFTIPRREVVIELAHRIKSTFPKAKVICVYGGQTEILEGNIIVLTTHQLFRYPNFFDLLIFDEIDAFPYKGNELLKIMFKKSIRGNYVIMSATPSKEIIKEIKNSGQILTLFTRFHLYEIPEPKIYYGFLFTKIIITLYKTHKYIKNHKPVLIFAPTIGIATYLFEIIKKFIKNGGLVHSKVKSNSSIINDFKKGKLNYLVTTSVLERGITIKGLQVIIFNADHDIYDKETLVQIAGRVGRKKEEPTGDIIFLITRITNAISASIIDIREKNEYLHSVYGTN